MFSFSSAPCQVSAQKTWGIRKSNSPSAWWPYNMLTGLSPFPLTFAILAKFETQSRFIKT